VLISLLRAAVLAQLPKSSELTTQTKTFVWRDDQDCCTQQDQNFPYGGSLHAKTISDYGVGITVLASVPYGEARIRIAVNALRKMPVYALSRATLTIQGHAYRPIDPDKQIRSAERDGSIRQTLAAIHGAKETSNVDVEDQNGRPIGTATVTTRDEAATQRQMDQVARETAVQVAAYSLFLRDYDAMPGSAPWGIIDFPVKIKKTTPAVFRIQIGDAVYEWPFDLVPEHH
jgi:hypothetical protein